MGDTTQTTALLVGISEDTNPMGTEYAVFNATTETYVAADGSTSIDPVWQTSASWSNLPITGLEPDTEYCLLAFARNGDGVVTSPGETAIVYTARENIPPRVEMLQVVGRDLFLEFSEPVAISMKDISVTNNSGCPVDLTGATLNRTPGSSSLSLISNGTLAGGSYTFTVSGSSVQDLAANLLDGEYAGSFPSGNDIPGGDFQFQFYILPGDANSDGTVNQADAAIVSANWLTQSGATWANGDFNDDGRVDDIDATMMAANWQRTIIPPDTSASVAVEPEPISYDLDNDGNVSLGDLAIFASVYREQPGITTENPYAYAADFDRSGTVDLGDLALFAANYRLDQPDEPIASSAVPQTALTMAAAPTMLPRRRQPRRHSQRHRCGNLSSQLAKAIRCHVVRR